MERLGAGSVQRVGEVALVLDVGGEKGVARVLVGRKVLEILQTKRVDWW